MLMSDKLSGAVSKIVEGATPGVVSISASIRNKEDTIRVDVDHIESLTIDQDYIHGFKDSVALQVSVPMHQAKQIMENYNDMKITLIITPVEYETGFPIDDVKPTVSTYRCLPYNTEDLDKMFHASSIQQTSDAVSPAVNDILVPLAFDLEEEVTYRARRISISSIFRNVTIEDILRIVLCKYGFKKIKIHKPDNKKKYKNLFIPPGINFEQTMSYLHKHYGVYDEDIGFYYTNGIMYVYPRTKVEDVTSKVTTHIFKVPEGMFSEIPATCYFKDNAHKVIASAKSISKRLAESGVEEVGTSVAFLADWCEFSPINHDKKTSYISENDISVVSVDPKRSTTHELQLTKYAGIALNEQTLRNQINSILPEYVGVGWKRALPNIIHPQQKVVLHYDGATQYKTQEGSFATCRYLFNRESMTGGTAVFDCICTAAIALSQSSYIYDEK